MSFYKTSRGVLVNLSYVTSIVRSDNCIIFCDENGNDWVDEHDSEGHAKAMFEYLEREFCGK